MFRAAAEICERQIQPPISLPPHLGTEAWAVFASRLSGHIKEHCGDWHDEAVRIFTEIAFPDERELSIDQIRWARRPPPKRGKPK
jgi:hypothetical protein